MVLTLGVTVSTGRIIRRVSVGLMELPALRMLIGPNFHTTRLCAASDITSTALAASNRKFKRPDCPRTILGPRAPVFRTSACGSRGSDAGRRLERIGGGETPGGWRLRAWRATARHVALLDDIRACAELPVVKLPHERRCWPLASSLIREETL